MMQERLYIETNYDKNDLFRGAGSLKNNLILLLVPLSQTQICQHILQLPERGGIEPRVFIS